MASRIAPWSFSLLLTLTSAMVAVSSIAARQVPAQFRGGVDLVAVDFLAIDSTGRPVTDLKPSELRLRVDGKVRDIRQLDFVKVSRTSAEAPVPVPGLPPPYGTNDRDLAGRMVVFVVDQEHLRPGEGKAAFDAAARFLDRLAPTDRVGLVTVPTGKIEVDVTTNHARVRQALATTVGKASRLASQWRISLNEAVAILAEQTDTDHPRTQELIDRECRYAGADSTCMSAVVQDALRIAREVDLRTRTTLRSLTDLFTNLARIEEPKTVVFISGALVTGREFIEDLADVTRAVGRARAQVYVIQPHEAIMDITNRDTPASTLEDEKLQAAGLADLAADSGGVLFRLSGLGDNAFTRIADEISAFYLLGFQPQSSERDGKRHKIELSSTRATVTLRARPVFVIDEPTKITAAPFQPATLIRDLATRRDLTLRVSAHAFRNTEPGTVKVVAVVDAVESSATLNGVAFALIDTQGRVVSEWTEDGPGVVVRPLVSAVVVPPGEYKLRVGAVDIQGRRGAADYEFRAALVDASPLRVNTLLLGTSEQGAFKPHLQQTPAAPDVTAYMEIYGVLPETSRLAVTFEIAVSPDAPAISSTPARILATREPDRLVATATVPTATLAPGDYLARAVLTLDGTVIGKTSRTLRRP